MYSFRLLSALTAASLIGLSGCSSESTSSFTPDPALQAKLDLITGCLPGHLEKLDELIAFSEIWRLNDAENPPDPAALAWSYDGTTVDYTITLTSFEISGTIGFYDAAGAAQSLTLSATSLSQLIDDAATALRSAHPAGGTFMVGDWVFAGIPTAGTVTSEGLTSSPAAFTGLIGGSLNQNELEELRSTVGNAAVSGGVPAVQECRISAVGTETCEFTFEMPSVLTDTMPGQEYPDGVLAFTLENTTSGTAVSGSLTMSGTVLARLDVDSFPGYFEINLETFSVIHRV